MNKTETVTIYPAKNITGGVSLPGDKSISHRYAMLAGVAEGTTKLKNFSSAADCASTLGCMEALGCAVRRTGGEVEIDGAAGKLHAPATVLDCGNSGSTMRMLSGILAAQEFASELTGDDSLRKRPMKRIMDPLRQMGAEIEAKGEGDRPPLRIAGRKLKGMTYRMPLASAQVKSCVLFAGLFAEGETTVEETVATRDHTEQALRAFGATVKREKGRTTVAGGQRLKSIEAYVPGDISSATFFLCAAGIFAGSNVVFDNVLLNPTRAALLDVMTQMGMKLNFLKVEDQFGELIGTVQAQASGLKGATIKGALTAALIDELPALAAIGPYTREGIEIRDAKELRVKESDRIAAVAENLRRMGAAVEEFEDGLRVPGGQKLHGAEIETYGDHRIAMAFSVAALRAEGETKIVGSEAVAVSYPEFFETLERMVER